MTTDTSRLRRRRRPAAHRLEPKRRLADLEQVHGLKGGPLEKAAGDYDTASRPGRDNGVGVLERGRHGLFHIDVFASRQRGQGRRRRGCGRGEVIERMSISLNSEAMSGAARAPKRVAMASARSGWGSNTAVRLTSERPAYLAA